MTYIYILLPHRASPKNSWYLQAMTCKATRLFSKTVFNYIIVSHTKIVFFRKRNHMGTYPTIIYVKTMLFSSENGFAVSLPPPGISADFHNPPP